MKPLISWPIPEAFVCTIIGIVAIGIAAGIVKNLPIAILVTLVIVLSVIGITSHLRAWHDPLCRGWWRDPPAPDPEPPGRTAMRLLACWPIPETLACLVLAGIAGSFIHDLPTSILVGAVVGLGIAAVGSYLRNRYDTEY